MVTLKKKYINRKINGLKKIKNDTHKRQRISQNVSRKNTYKKLNKDLYLFKKYKQATFQEVLLYVPFKCVHFIVIYKNIIL